MTFGNCYYYYFSFRKVTPKPLPLRGPWVYVGFNATYQQTSTDIIVEFAGGGVLIFGRNFAFQKCLVYIRKGFWQLKWNPVLTGIRTLTGHRKLAVITG